MMLRSSLRIDHHGPNSKHPAVEHYTYMSELGTSYPFWRIDYFRNYGFAEENLMQLVTSTMEPQHQELPDGCPTCETIP